MPHSLLLDRNTWAYLKIRDTLNFKFRRLKEHGSWRCQSSKRHPHQSKSSNHINHSNHLKKDIKQSSTNHQPIINQSSNFPTSQANSKDLPSPGLHAILEPRPQQDLPQLRLRQGQRHLCRAERQQRQGNETSSDDTPGSHGQAG